MATARTEAPDATITGIQSQIAQAKAAGYSDDDITAHLSKMPGYSQKMKTATDAGYKPSEIVGHLAGGAAKPWEKYAAQAQGQQQAIDPKSVIWDDERKPSAKASAPAGNPWDNDPIYKPLAKASAAGNPWDNDPIYTPPAAATKDGGIATKLAKGAAMGVADIGNTVLNAGVGALTLGGKVLPGVAQWNRTRNADMDYITDQNKDSTAFQVGRVGANIAATLPVGGIIGAGIKAVSSAPRAVALANAIGSGGFSTGAASGAANMLTRAAGGAINGAASTALINPGEAGTGALIGGALPVGLSGLNKLAPAMGGALRGGAVSDEVRTLAAKAKALGIDIPADRLVNSKPMNALASTLNYVPFSGRAATESRMDKQLTQAATRTFGQDSDNMAQALRKAGDELGGKFDAVLKNNSVNFSQKFMTDITDVYNTAQKELGSDGLKAIGGQIDELIAKGANGVIDGQAAYNIKRTLDRIGQRNTPEAYHAIELKGALMDALNDSIGTDAAKAFAKTREQYSNMLALERLAKNGADGEISVARLANMRNINNKPLQDIADIAAQFVKPRESQHGAMQRAVAGMAAGTVGGPVGFAAAVGSGRATNMLLNSSMAKNFALRDPSVSGALRSGFNSLADVAAPSLYRIAPPAGSAAQR
jgi:hypothetical protein